jgi:hypothetical protein
MARNDSYLQPLPWLVTKIFFVSLSLVISSKDSLTSKNIDVFLAPLVEDLMELWRELKHSTELRTFRRRVLVSLCREF